MGLPQNGAAKPLDVDVPTLDKRRCTSFREEALQWILNVPVDFPNTKTLEELDGDDEEFRKWYKEKYGEPYNEHNSRFTQPKHNNLPADHILCTLGGKVSLC